MFLLQLVILQILIFGGLIFALRSILTKNISSATTHLDEMNSEFIKREEEIKKRQEEAENLLQDAINKAKDEADRIRLEAEKEVQAQKEKMMEEAHLVSEEIIQKAQKSKEMMTDELRQALERKILMHVGDLMSKMYPEAIREKLHRLWLEDLLNGPLNELGGLNISPDIQEARIISAFELTADERRALEKKLSQSLGRKISLKEEMNQELLGGIVVVLGSAELDGSISNRIRQLIGEYAHS